MIEADRMPVFALSEDVPGLLAEARGAASAGRAGRKLVGGPHSRMTQTVIALRAGARLSEHENPGEATLLVLEGRVRLEAVGGVARDGGAHDLMQIPDCRHALVALEDSVVLLTAVKSAGEGRREV